jgi:3-oxoacyl-[acyl-carrier protein] reductase
MEALLNVFDDIDVDYEDDTTEEYQNGVRVHAICPGGVYTDMVKLSRPDLTSDGMTLPQDIAELCWFFLYMRGNAVIDEIIVHRANKQPFLV